MTASKCSLISVIVTSHNLSLFLGQAIESILGQTHPHFEIILVDDGSTDSTLVVAGSYPTVRVISQSNQGAAAARNTGIRESKGDYLVFLDGDDRLLPEALETGLKFLTAYPECAFVSGRCRLIASDGTPLPVEEQADITGEHYLALLQGNYIWTPATVMYRGWIFDLVTGFDTSLRNAEDYELYFRIGREYPIHHHGQLVAEYRRHASNKSHDSARMLKSIVSIFRAQRPYVRSYIRYEQAYKTGLRFSQDYYARQLIEQTWDRVCTRDNWNQVIRNLLVLMKYYPMGLAKHIGRKIFYFTKKAIKVGLKISFMGVLTIKTAP